MSPWGLLQELLVTEASNRPLQRLPTQVAVTVPIVQGEKLRPWGTTFWGAGQVTGG